MFNVKKDKSPAKTQAIKKQKEISSEQTLKATLMCCGALCCPYPALDVSIVTQEEIQESQHRKLE